MQLWTLAPNGGNAGSCHYDGLAPALVRHIGEPDFNSQALAKVNDLLPVGSWSVYRLAPGETPEMFLSGSHDIPDTTRDCWRAYLNGLYRQDRTFAVAGGGGIARHDLLMTHWTACEIDRPHRDEIYLRHGVRERVSVFGTQNGRDLLSVNLYRHDHQTAFGSGEIRDIRHYADLIYACVQRHVALTAVAAVPAAASAGAAPLAASNTPPANAVDLAERLRAICPDMPTRESEVCVRLALGLTQDGIAVDLGISPSTVKTYRNRAFGRLGINFRNELFGRLLSAGGG